MVLFIENANRRIYSNVLKTLENNYLMGQDNYKMCMATSQKILINYKPMPKASGDTGDGITFLNDGIPRSKKHKS